MLEPDSILVRLPFRLGPAGTVYLSGVKSVLMQLDQLKIKLRAETARGKTRNLI